MQHVASAQRREGERVSFFAFTSRISEVGDHRAWGPVVEHAVAQVFGVKRGDLHVATRGRANVALARQVSMYLAHVSCSMTLTEVGAVFQRDRTTVAHACGLVEDRRDDMAFDRTIELLECILHSLTRPYEAPCRQDQCSRY